jgi:hypothetical protein
MSECTIRTRDWPKRNGSDERRSVRGTPWAEIRLVFGKPIEKQQQRVDLVVVGAIRDRNELIFEIGEPRSFVRQQDATRFEAALLPAMRITLSAAERRLTTLRRVCSLKSWITQTRFRARARHHWRDRR